jgi:hypothetical protein
VVLLSSPVFTQDRPDEGDLFGGETIGEEKSADNKADADSKNTGEKETRTDGLVNPIQVGGTFYQRFVVSPQENMDAADVPITMPMLIDAFIDGRPSDRIRVFVNARILYDPTRDENMQTTSGSSLGSASLSSTVMPGMSAGSASNPDVVLDQAWVKFDIERAVFFTGGSQRIKWGTARFWNPTDFVNIEKRDPLLPYDLRPGLPMLRIDIPWEKISANFTVLGFLDQPVPASTLGQLGAGARMEFLLGNTEIGFDAVYKDGEKLYGGMDVSAPLGPFDVYAEAAYLNKASAPFYSLDSSLTELGNLSDFYTTENIEGPVFQASAGINLTFAWLLNRTATVGAEYYYNQLGYDSADVYPVLILNGDYQPFYLGKHYAAVYMTAEGPDKGHHTSYTLSVLANLSDMSFIGRLDFRWEFLTYMTFEAFASGHLGTEGGEFNFALDTPAVFYETDSGFNYIPALDIPPTIFDIGLAIRTRF